MPLVEDNEDGVPSANKTYKKPQAQESVKLDETQYECNICLSTAENSVITKCGHLYCWKCFHLQSTGLKKVVCLKCKLMINSNDIIPIFGRNSAKSTLDANIPPRPQAKIKKRGLLNLISSGDYSFHMIICLFILTLGDIFFGTESPYNYEFMFLAFVVAIAIFFF